MAGVQTNKTSRVALAAVLIAIVAAFALVGGIALIVLDALEDDPVAGPSPSDATVPTSPSSSPPGGTDDVPSTFEYGTGECAPEPPPEVAPTSFEDAPRRCIDEGTTYKAVVTTNRGSFTITLDASASPGNVNNFVTLSRWGYYDGTECGPVILDFSVQCGRPAGVEDAPGYTVADELPEAGAYVKGVVAMANLGRPDTAGGEWFVLTGDDAVTIAPTYTVIGTVTKGLGSTVARLNGLGDPAAPEGGPPTKPIRIRSVRIVET